ncbi:maternal effect protein oskar-like [Sitodiplosis mosellana]|uniref:maternal effect protein oskar-like n=1 Tax=Sitodiplosis mosellana TaxID=263140 RepID=UPI0024448666|nr:maternal effect protein oskar-like [Sitodiplosis mosellana]
MRYHNLELDMLLRGMVMTRGENGATISEMRSDYYKIYGEQWPLQHESTRKIIQYLMEIDGLILNQHEDGLCIWYIDDIGINVSEHDSNNNVIMIDTTVVTESEKNQPVHNNSYALPAPRCRMITSSLVRENAQEVSSTSTSSDTLLIESIDNGHLKRNLSQLSQSHQSMEKRKRLMPPNGLRLNEENLDIHNRENGTGEMVKQTTSTEIEKSISIPNDVIDGCIAANDYIAPIKEPESKQLQQSFAKRCRINSKHDFILVDSVESTMSLEEQLFPPSVSIIGDDYMRSLISFELYGADFTNENDKRFEYCISGQTVREAYHLVLDKQNRLTSQCRYLIVNVGAIDVLLQRNFIDIISEYARLIRAILTIGLTPIITTIPNLWINSNNPNYKTIYQTLLLFNQFLLSQYGDGYKLLDLHSCFSDHRKHFPSIYYHNHPKVISKGDKKLELWRWTELGRKKILDKINLSLHTLTDVQ